MNKTLRVILILIVIPLFGMLAGQVARGSFEKGFREDIAYMISEEPELAEEWRGVTLASYCEEVFADPAPYQDELAECRAYKRSSTLTIGSLLALLLGLGLLGWIVYASRAATLDQRKLLKMFGPGVRLMLFGAFTLILMQSLIASYGFMTLQYALMGGITWSLVIAILIGGLSGSFYMLRGGLSVFKPVESDAFGVAVTREEQPNLWKLVDRIAEHLHAAPPKNIVLGFEPTFYATNAAVRVGPSGRVYRNGTMYLSLPLMRILSIKELGAIIGHELAHFRGEDTRFSIEFYPIYAGSSHALCVLHAHTGDFWHSVPLWPAISIMDLFLERFAVAESKVSRHRELLADRAGAIVGSAKAIATSLLKFGAYAPNWERIERRMRDEADRGRTIKNASLEFGRLCAAGAIANPLDVVDSEPPQHPTDSHPPTAKRIRALGIDPKSLERADLDPVTKKPSSGVIVELERLEEHLTSAAEKYLLEMGRDDDD